MKNCILIFLCLTMAFGCKNNPNIYKEASAPIQKRVDNLISQMSLDEKIAQLYAVYYGKSGKMNLSFTDDDFKKAFENGIGQVCQPGKRRTPKEAAELSNQIQKYLIEKTRLGIPAILHEEGLHGMIANGVTSFPTPIAMACSWNEVLINQAYDKIGREMRSVGITLSLSPVLDVAREPRWGRFEETFGEDPFLVSRAGVAAVKGYQGTDKNNALIDGNHVIATAKHFCGYSYPEGGHNVAPSLATERDLWEVFLPPFKAAVEEANLLSIMPSYNEVNAVPSHANKWLLTDLMRNQTGFKGLYCSDYGGVQELISLHRVAADEKHAALLAFKAGVDYDLPNNTCYKYLKDLVAEGKITEAEIDEKVKKVLYIKFMLGLFDKPYVDVEKATAFVADSAGKVLELQMAKESVILLKNDKSILPLQPQKYKTIAVIGPNANECELGAYYGSPKYCITPLNGITKKLGNDVKILFAEGCKISREIRDSSLAVKQKKEDPDKYDVTRRTILSTPQMDKPLIDQAIKTAQQSDAVILVIGGNYGLTRESFAEKPQGDRDDLSLTPSQKFLYEKISALGKPVIVVLIHGGPIADMGLYSTAPTILECHYLGQETGTAIASVLVGETNPSGKLAYSVPRNAAQVPSFYNYKTASRRGYGFTDNGPAFPFGYGLSYTTFGYSNLKIEKDSVKPQEINSLSVVVENTGNFDGSEIVQLYICDEVSSVTRPGKELKAFKKIFLKRGEKQTVSFSITPEMLSFYNIDMKYTVEPGNFTVLVGKSSKDQDLLKTKFKVVEK